jgi:hypothetical protein
MILWNVFACTKKVIQQEEVCGTAFFLLVLAGIVPSILCKTHVLKFLFSCFQAA